VINECINCYGVPSVELVDSHGFNLDYACSRCVEYAGESIAKHIGAFSWKALV
jgi:hypothetical protein